MKHRRSFHQHYDALIVGARCAGAATAMLLARQGARVLLVDWAGPGTETISTHALMRGAVMQLSRWGVLSQITASGTPAIRQTTFHYGDETISLPIKPSHGVQALYAPRRSVLDGALVAAARAAGVTVRYGTAFRNVLTDTQGRVVGAVLADRARNHFNVFADIVVGADGRRSTVARRVQAGSDTLARNATACLFGYMHGLPDTGTHWFYRPGIGCGAIPTNNGTHCVFAALPPQRFKAEARRARTTSNLAGFVAETNREFGALVARARLAGRLIGFTGQKGFVRRSWGEGWALVGDAGYFKDPLTAHGITDALRDAEILANAIAAGSSEALAGYQSARDAISKDLFEITEEIAGLQWGMSRLKTLHLRLNAAMKHEQDWMDDRFAQASAAA